MKTIFKLGIALFGMLSVFTSCEHKADVDYSNLVDPFIGTGGHGHTFPGATTPFGMVQLSPDTGIEGWDWCSGYHDSDSSIIGFSHTHLSGTGGADYGDILLMPSTGDLKFEPGTKQNPDLGYRSRFSKSKEKASPGYYGVILEDYKIKAELTATARTGMHRYTFPKSDESHIILDLKHGISDKSVETKFEIISPNKIQGYRKSQGWARQQWVYFAIELSKPFLSSMAFNDNKEIVDVKTLTGKGVKLAINFKTLEQEQIMVKVAISSVSEANAWENMESENPKVFDFDKIRLKAKTIWNKELAKIEIEGGTKEQQRIFYTSLYHTMIHPNLLNDVNGEFRAMDMKVHKAKKHDQYTLYSLWDTFRALHPLYSLIYTEKNDEFINSMLVKYQNSGKLPVWELWSNETNTMIGYHSIPVIADAILKNTATFDVELAYEAMKHSAMDDGRGLKYYKELGFIPRELEDNSVSKTLEYAFDDYAIAQVAKKLGKEDDYQYFSQRATNYRNLFDESTKFMRGKDAHGRWNPNFDPMSISLFGSGDFTEGNSWHYSFFAPQDINGLIDLYGGDEAFVAKLDEMFAQDAVNDNEHAHDVTGLMGQYAQGNEPSHHVIYTYNFAGRPDRTQELIRAIMDEMYTDKVDGLSGNEDTGQMSAWYVLSSMGIYPMNPVGGQFVIGSPVFDKVTLHLENGKSFVIKANNNSDKNIYIQSATLNGEQDTKSFINYSDIEKGGELIFEMGYAKSTWGSDPNSRPVSKIVPNISDLGKIENRALMPFIEDEKLLFKDIYHLNLKSNTVDASIFYTLDGSDPDENATKFNGEIVLNKSTHIKAIAIKEGYKNSPIYEAFIRKAHFRDGKSSYPKVELNSKLGKSYNPGANTLMDGVFGSNNLRDGNWTGIQGDDLKVEIDLGKQYPLNKVTLGYLNNTGSWIFPPKEVKVYTSADGKNYKLTSSLILEAPKGHLNIERKFVELTTKTKARYLKVVAENFGKLPNWHPGAGSDAYIFVDEITVE